MACTGGLGSRQNIAYIRRFKREGKRMRKVQLGRTVTDLAGDDNDERRRARRNGQGRKKSIRFALMW